MTKSYVAMLCCPRCGKETGVVLDKRLKKSFDEHGCYADTEPCEECQAEIDEIMAVVKEGGLAFYCKGCDREGAIRLSDSSRDFILSIREKYKDEREDWQTFKVGVEFPDCTWHQKLGYEDDTENKSDDLLQ